MLTITKRAGRSSSVGNYTVLKNSLNLIGAGKGATLYIVHAFSMEASERALHYQTPPFGPGVYG